MAEEKARAPRARKATKAASGAAAETKTTKASAAKKGAPAEKASARTTPKGTPATPKTTAAKPARATQEAGDEGADDARARARLGAGAHPRPDRRARVPALGSGRAWRSDGALAARRDRAPSGVTGEAGEGDGQRRPLPGGAVPGPFPGARPRPSAGVDGCPPASPAPGVRARAFRATADADAVSSRHLRGGRKDRHHASARRVREQVRIRRGGRALPGRTARGARDRLRRRRRRGCGGQGPRPRGARRRALHGQDAQGGAPVPEAELGRPLAPPLRGLRHGAPQRGGGSSRRYGHSSSGASVARPSRSRPSSSAA